MNLSIEPIEGKREIIRKYDALHKMSHDDDVERLLVEPLVLVALQLLDLVQAAALLDHLGYLGKRKRENHISAALLMIRLVTRLANDRRPGRLRDSKIMVDFKILVDRLLNHDRHRFHQDLAPEMEL